MTDKITTNVIYQAKLHWIIFLWPIILIVAGMIAGIEVSLLKEVSIFFVVFGLIWLVITWVNYYFSSLTIKQKQVILCTGILVRKITDMPLTKIETIDIRQTILGSMIRYGTLIITGTGGTRHFINYLDKPLTCRRYIEQLMHE